MDKESYIVHIQTKYVYKDISDNVEKRSDTSNYTIERPLPKGKNERVIELMKNEFGEEIMTEFARLRPNIYFYLIYDGSGDKKS